MDIQTTGKSDISPAVKLGVSRQVVIPKEFYDKLKLSPGDYLQVELKEDELIFRPKSLVDKGIAEGLKDIKQGRSHGPFDTADDFLASLHSNVKKRRNHIPRVSQND